MGRKRKGRYQDVKSAGKSELVPYDPGETYRQRHERRKREAAIRMDDLKSWCHKHSIKVEIKNEGHHWIFTRDNWVCEWWPSSAKFVIDKQFNKGIHVHDISQVILLLQGSMMDVPGKKVR